MSAGAAHEAQADGGHVPGGELWALLRRIHEAAQLGELRHQAAGAQGVWRCGRERERECVCVCVCMRVCLFIYLFVCVCRHISLIYFVLAMIYWVHCTVLDCT